MKIKYLLTLFLALALTLTACSKKGDTVRIGLAAVQTGTDGQFGSKMLQGSQIAIDEWNARGGVAGKKIESISRDDEGKPNQAVAVAHELVARKVIAIIGHFNSGCTLPSSTIYAQGGILQITPGSSNPQVTEQGIPTVFRTCGRDDQQGPVMAEFAYHKLGKRKVTVLHNKTTYGQGFAEEFKKRFEALGGTVTSFTGISAEELDFRANVEVIKKEGAEAIFWGGMYSQAGPLYNQMRQAGLDLAFLSGDGTYEQEFLNTVGPQARNIYLTFGSDYQSQPEAKAFLDKYRARYGQEGPYSIYGYESANILLQALEKIVNQSGWDSVNGALLAKTLHEGSFNTTMGTLEFDSKGDLKKVNYIIWTSQAGKFVPLKD